MKADGTMSVVPEAERYPGIRNKYKWTHVARIRNELDRISNDSDNHEESTTITFNDERDFQWYGKVNSSLLVPGGGDFRLSRVKWFRRPCCLDKSHYKIMIGRAKFSRSKVIFRIKRYGKFSNTKFRREWPRWRLGRHRRVS